MLHTMEHGLSRMMNTLQKLLLYMGSIAVIAISIFGVPMAASAITTSADAAASTLASSTETALSDNTDPSIEDATADITIITAARVDDDTSKSDDNE